MNSKDVVEEFFIKMKQTEEYKKVIDGQLNSVGDQRSDYEDMLHYNFRADQFYYGTGDETDWVICMDEKYTTWHVFD